MSGVKDYNVSLRQSEYNKLMNSAREVDRQAERQQALQYELENARKQMSEMTRQANRREAALEESIDSLSEGMQQQERVFQQKMKDQQTKMKEELNQVNKKMQAELTDLDNNIRKTIGDLDSRMQQGFNDVNAKINQGFANVDKKLGQQREEYTALFSEHAKELSKINKQNKREEDLANQWLSDTKVMLDYIEVHQQHQKFSPNELSKLKQQHASLKSNIENKFFQSAIATGQDLYQKAIELRTKIQLNQIEWDSYYALSLEDARALLAKLDTQYSAKWMMDAEQGTQELDAEVDYWTDNGLSSLKQEVNDSINSLDSTDLSIEDLKKHAEETQKKEIRLQILLERAKERLIASQLRSDMADNLLDNLAKSGWQLTDEAWQGESEDGRGWKNSLHMKLVDQGNNEMVTIIYPVDQGEGKIENKIEFAYYPHNNNDATFHSRQTMQLGKMLTGMNLNGDGQSAQLKCVAGHAHTLKGDAKRYDLEQARMSSKV